MEEWKINTNIIHQLVRKLQPTLQPFSPNSFVNLSWTSTSDLLTVAVCLAKTLSKSVLEIVLGRICNQISEHIFSKTNHNRKNNSYYFIVERCIISYESTFEANPFAVSSFIVISTAPGCLDPQVSHMPSEVLWKKTASRVLRTHWESTSFTCQFKRCMNYLWTKRNNNTPIIRVQSIQIILYTYTNWNIWAWKTFCSKCQAFKISFCQIIWSIA